MLARLEKWLLFLVILFLPTQLGKHFWPNFAYIYSLKIDYLSPTLYFWDLLVIGLLVVWILRKPKINMPAVNVFLLFLFTQALSLFKAVNIGAGVVRLEQYLIAGTLGIFLAAQDFRSLSKKIFLPLSLGILGESVLSILQFIKGSTLGLWILGERSFNLSTPGIAKFDFYGIQFLRPYATFPHPNVLAGFMLIGIAILSSRRMSGSNSELKVFNWIPAFAGMTMFLTMSRVAILAGIISAAVLFRKKGFIFLVIAVLLVSPILFTRFSSLVNFDYLTVLRREEMIASSWQIFLQSPFLGIGLNNFIPAAASDLLTGPSRFLQPVHNIFLLALSETGIIGLLGLVVLIGFPILRLLKIKPFLLPWFLIIFLGMFDHYLLTLPQGYRMLFLVWGLSFSKL